MQSDRPLPRCESHDLALSPEGTCIVCRREQDAAGASSSSGMLRWGIAAAIGTALFAGGALARGALASKLDRKIEVPAVAAQVAPPVFAPEGELAPPGNKEAPATAKPVEVEPTLGDRLDDALAVTKARRTSASTPEVSTPEVTASSCTCRPRAPRQPRPVARQSSVDFEDNQNPWGEDHDRGGHLRFKSHLDTGWHKKLHFEAPNPASGSSTEPSTCSCPSGTERVGTVPNTQRVVRPIRRIPVE